MSNIETATSHESSQPGAAAPEATDTFDDERQGNVERWADIAEYYNNKRGPRAKILRQGRVDANGIMRQEAEMDNGVYDHTRGAESSQPESSTPEAPTADQS